MTAWIVRAGRHGEREQWALQNNLAGVGFHEVPDMTNTKSRDDVFALIEAAFPSSPPMRIVNFTGQLWALRNTIQPGDLVVMPLKTSPGKIAMGVVTSGYTYRTNEPDPESRHTIGVDWKVQDVSRAVIKDDLLNTLNGAMTVFQAKKNNAEKRLRHLMEHGTDPGNNASPVSPKQPTSTPSSSDESVVDPNPVPTLEAIRDRVRTHLIEEFSGHKLTHLIADILRTQGYTCHVSPEGPDGGVDIIAGSGPLGLDAPTLIVEVKSEAGAVGVQVLRGLQAAIGTHKANQGLLVAWGGLNKQAQAEHRTDRLRIGLWDAETILDRLFDAYDQLPDATRARIPLKRAWVLDEETG